MDAQAIKAIKDLTSAINRLDANLRQMEKDKHPEKDHKPKTTVTPLFPN